MSLVVLILIIWFLSPLVLLPWCIVASKRNSAFKRRISELEDELLSGHAKLDNGHSSRRDQDDAYTPAAYEADIADDDTYTPAEHDADIIDNTHTFVNHEADNANTPIAHIPDTHEADITNTNNATINKINVVLIIGAAFIILSGVIFASATWDFLNNAFRSVVILFLSSLFFLFSYIAERKLKLPKMGMAFYTIGSFFLPSTLLSIGYFRLLGNWFSVSGDGRHILYSVIFGTLFLVTLRGAAAYVSKIFAWGSLLSLSLTVANAAYHFTMGNYGAFALSTAVYSFLFMLACKPLAKRENKTFGVVQSVLLDFAAVNSALFSLFTLFAFDFNGMTFVAYMIFASAFLHSVHTSKNGFVGAVPFSIFTATGLYRLVDPGGVGGFSFVASAISFTIAVMSLMGIMGDKIQKAFRALNVFALFIALLVGAIGSFWLNAENGLTLLLSMAFLTANMAFVIVRANGNRFRLPEDAAENPLSGAFALQLILLVNVSARLLISAPYVSWYATCIGILAMAAILKLPGRHALRGVASDVVFIIGMSVSTIVVLAKFMMINRYGDHYDADGAIMAMGSAAALFVLFVINAFGRKTNEIVAAVCRFAAPLAIFGTVEPMCFYFWHFGDKPVPKSVPFVWMAVITGAVLAALYKSDRSRQAAMWKLPLTAGMFLTGITLFCSEELLATLPLYMILGFFTLYFLVRAFMKIEDKWKSNCFAIGSLLCMVEAYLIADNFLFSSLHSEEKLILCLCFPAFIAIASLLIRTVKSNFQFDKEAFYIGHISFSLLTFVSAAFFLGWDFYARLCLYAVPYAAMLAITIFFAYRDKFTLPVILPLLMIFPMAFAVFGDHLSYDPIAALAFLSLLAISRFVHKKVFAGKYIDPLAFAAAPYLFYMVTHGNEYWAWSAWIFIGVYFLNLIGRSKDNLLNGLLLTASSVSALIAMYRQPFFTLPELFKTEYYIAWGMLFFYAMSFVWKNRRYDVDILTFVAAVGSIFWLCYDAANSKHIFDTLIVLTAVLSVLLLSLEHKRKKWFLLSVIPTLFMPFFMSETFWSAMLWWGYFTVIGTILITIGVRAEIKRRNAAKDGRDDKPFGADWEW